MLSCMHVCMHVCICKGAGWSHAYVHLNIHRQHFH